MSSTTKIVGFDTYLVQPRWLFLRIDTDEGVTGWGEPIVEGRAETRVVSAEMITVSCHLFGHSYTSAR